MKKKRYAGIRAKIVIYTILCVVAVGLISNLFLYQYMNKIITEKVESIDTLYAKTIAAQLDYALERMQTLNYYCSSSEGVATALEWGSLDTLPARKDALTAQDTINSYLRTSPVDSYVNKLFLFNDNGVIIHALSTGGGTPLDLQRLMLSEQYQHFVRGALKPFDALYPSLNPGGPDCFVLLSPVYSVNSRTPLGYVYVEIDARIVTDVLSPYNVVNRFYVRTASGDRLIPDKDRPMLEEVDAQGSAPVDRFTYDSAVYAVHHYPLEEDTLTLSSCINQTELMASNQDMGFSVAMVTLMIIGIVTAVLLILTHYVTVPIQRIMEKINKIALNDYSFDPTLEKPRNEMGEVGARLNELGLGIQKLLDETIALHDERTEIEMALLQSQVNPHFLYNTLNSVHWMAVMQKNPGIEKLVKSLVNLLKNVSKGVSDKIPLSGELALLDDYISIQSVRYMGAFDYVCNIPEALRDYKIIKFTLQPLVENAIFHGVVPKGTFGTITLDAHEDEDFLVVTVTDDGMGMLPEEAAALLKLGGRPDKSSMSGIGVANVNRRLKLAYGRDCGLAVDSRKGEFTTISVHIKKEA